MKVLALVWILATIGETYAGTCKLFIGDGKGGREVWVGYLSRQHCIDTCVKRKITIDDSINGATVYANAGKKGCYCESGMTYRSTSTTWKSCFLEIPEPNPGVSCALYMGAGKGGTYVYIGALSRSECVAACIKRKNEVDDSINGVAVRSNINKKGCYCEKAMTYRSSSTKWKSCFLRIRDVNAHQKCAFYPGDGKGGSEIWIGYLTRSECVAACIKRKATEDDLINGAVVYANPTKKGCYCEKGMRYRNTATKWLSCFLRVPDPNANKKCQLYYGDGEGGSYIKLGSLTRSECIDACIARKKTHDDSINGVVVYANPTSKGCYCRKAMRYRDTSKKWKSCLLRQSAPINPCMTNNGGCDQKCCNKNGVAQCSCKDGYYPGMDYKTCHDINECLTAVPLLCSQGCNNTDGSYQCTCFHGYKLGKDGRTCVATQRCNGQDNGCCTVETPCDVGEGDCDKNNQCAAGLVCGTNNCPWGDHDDCCVKPTQRCHGQDNGCCTVETPCDIGEGDCDKNNQCAAGLVCGTDNCPWGDHDDCCVKPPPSPKDADIENF